MPMPRLEGMMFIILHLISSVEHWFPVPGLLVFGPCVFVGDYEHGGLSGRGITAPHAPTHSSPLHA